MIFYAEDTEQWEDTDDNTFKVSMTPEGKERDLTFSSREEFYTWCKEKNE